MRYYFPFNLGSTYAVPWYYWWSHDPRGGDNPEEPPDIVKKQMALYDTLRVTGDLGEQNDLIMQILDIAAEQFYCIGISLPGNSYGIQKNNFYNVPKSMPSSWTYPQPGPSNPCQYFIKP
jgi:peptide/nickel transport system substrate-binding protein